jgi:predicted small metal-binding protein
MATFRCRDLGLSCEFEAEAKGEHEIMKRVEGHVITVHDMDIERPEVKEQIKKAVKE